MAQSRKKTTSFQKQKVAQAQYRNEFISKLKQVINTINGDEISSKIPLALLDRLYENRVRSFKLIVAPGCTVSSSTVNHIKNLISRHSKLRKLTVPGPMVVNLAEFFTVILSVSVILPQVISDDFPHLKTFKEKLDKFCLSIEGVFDYAIGNFHNLLFGLGLCFNDISKTLYGLNHEIPHIQHSKYGLENKVIINTYKIESLNIMVGDASRPVIHVCYVFSNSIEWISITPSVLKISNSSSNIPLDVYIQSHALKRLSERIDCFLEGIVHYNMFISLKSPVVYHYKGNILIEYRLFDIKAGYFLIDIVGDKIIIKTFLFILNNNTPESEMLGNLTGLQKLDRQYLALDKLSTFMTSDIGSNENVRSILTSAGCQCLLDLYEKHHGLAIDTSKKFNIELMLKYIDYEKHLPESMHH